MRQILAVGVPVIGNFVLWALITKLPVHSTIIFALVILVGILMIYSLSHFARMPSQGSSSK
jgi:hypothetical protein